MYWNKIRIHYKIDEVLLNSLKTQNQHFTQLYYFHKIPQTIPMSINNTLITCEKFICPPLKIGLLLIPINT